MPEYVVEYDAGTGGYAVVRKTSCGSRCLVLYTDPDDAQCIVDQLNAFVYGEV